MYPVGRPLNIDDSLLRRALVPVCEYMPACPDRGILQLAFVSCQLFDNFATDVVLCLSMMFVMVK